MSGIFSATAANAIVGISNNSMAGDLLHLGVGSSAATFSAINQTAAIQHPAPQPNSTGASPQKPTPISSTSSNSAHILGGGQIRQPPPLSSHPSMSPTGSHLTSNSNTMHPNGGGPNSIAANSSVGDVSYNGTELVMLYDYKVNMFFPCINLAYYNRRDSLKTENINMNIIIKFRLKLQMIFLFEGVIGCMLT